jgi:DNA-binding response OmpR family regulator
MHFLIVDPDLSLAARTADVLRRRGAVVDLAPDLSTADARLRERRYDLVLLDWAFPGETGIAFLGHLRQQQPSVSILVVSGRATLDDRVRAFNLGADGLLAEPFALAELIARVEALMRRRIGGRSATVLLGRLALDTRARTASVGGVTLDLSPRELAVLEALILEAGSVVRKQTVFDRVFDAEAVCDMNAIEVYVHRLRKKVQPAGIRIRTMRGVGYVIEDARHLDRAA